MSHGPYDQNDGQGVETTLRDLLASVEDIPFGKVRPNDVRKLVNSFRVEKKC
jgi:hypothetical protein